MDFNFVFPSCLMFWAYYYLICSDHTGHGPSCISKKIYKLSLLSITLGGHWVVCLVCLTVSWQHWAAGPGNYFLPATSQPSYRLRPSEIHQTRNWNNVLLSGFYNVVLAWYQYSFLSILYSFFTQNPRAKNHRVIIICLRFNCTINLIWLLELNLFISWFTESWCFYSR